MKYVSVVVDNNTNATDELYTYKCDIDGVTKGSRVKVPFSIHNRMADAYVVSLSDTPPEGVSRFKKVESLDPDLSLTEEAMDTAIWMKARYVCRYIEAVKCFLPGNTMAKRRTKDPFENLEYEADDPKVLNPMQKKALEQIEGPLENKTQETFLLYGVTGSGKTEIYLQAMAKCLQKGRCGIILVPEISLTPQTVSRFMNRFGKESIAVLHSKLTPAQKSVEYRKIASGKVQFVIGARSAVFAPFKDIGLIIIDEEHESSYKSDKSPKYDAMEVALKRAKAHKAVLVLGSATPAVTDFYRAGRGIFKKIELKERYNLTPLPRVVTVDMREEVKAGNRSLFSASLADALEDCLKEKKQAILFLNRRGYSSFVSCRECGYVPRCSECGISLTYHKDRNALVCHYCGHAESQPKICPKCGSKVIGRFGAGTEQVEEKARELFPEARIARLDLDTISKKGQLESILKGFSKGNTDILIGTQLVAKGLDIANVALVGVISADVTLNIPDYRSSERTFQLITQAAGRAGRGTEQGKVFIQTYSPESAVIQAAAEQDYDKFYRREEFVRKAALYPPFSDLFLFVISDEDEEKCMVAAKKCCDWFTRRLGKEYMVMSPCKAPVARQLGLYRYQVLVKAPMGKRQECSLAAAAFRKKFEEGKGMARLLTMDINPFSFI